jgi:hypothetical protein
VYFVRLGVYGFIYVTKKVVGVFVAFSCATHQSNIHMCIMCVKIPKGTKYAFLSGMKLRGGFSAFTDDSKHSEIIDKTQGDHFGAHDAGQTENQRNHLICEESMSGKSIERVR